MNSIVNIDLLTVGVAVAGNIILGFAVFFSNKKSLTNILFLFLSVSLSSWSVVNYLSYQTSEQNLALLLVRMVMFFAAPIGALFLLFADVFPGEKFSMPKKNIISIIFLMVVSMALSLSPFVFSGVTLSENSAPQPITEPGILSFIVVPVLAIIFGISILIKKIKKSSGLQRTQYKFVLFGVLVMFALIIILNFLLPAFLKSTRFIPLSALFTLPFVAFSAYAIFKHHLLNIKVISTEILTFILAIATFFEVIISENALTLVLRSGIFSLVLAFGILLIKSVRKEVEQREELAKINIELRKAKLELEKLSQFKSQMLRLASHQIKAPLATIKGFASIIIEGLYGPVSDKIKETVMKMKDSSDELINLINDLLDLGKIEQGKMDYKFEPVKLKDLIQKVMDGLKVQADAKKLEFTFVSGSEANISADVQKFKQVLQNLIENGVKYTLKGFVKVATREEGDSIVFSVTDSGPGISADRLPKLFDQELVRDERPEYKSQSTGTGLYIAKRIITPHGGSIWAESDGEGKGSRFFVRLRKI